MSAASIVSPLEAAERLLACIVKPARLLVAISGGSDSAGLLVSLVRANTTGSGVIIHAVTIDHALRPESAQEAVSVATLCGRLGIRHFIRRWEGEKPKSGISAASREARYRLLVDVADEIDATAILTGHTLDDQAETVAMRAARGEGKDNLGLAGMAEAVLLDRRRWLLRPFLRCSRVDIRKFLSEAGEGWIDDPSNRNSRYERVRVRDRLSQEAAFDDESTVRAGKRRTALSDAAADWIQNHLTIRHGVLARVAPEGLAGDPLVRRHALSALTALLGGREYLPGSESMDRVMAFLDGGQPGRITAGRVIFDMRREGLYVVRENRGMMPLHIAADGSAVWDGRYRIVNDGKDEVVVGPTAPDRDEAIRLFPDVPPAIAMRATTAMPWVDAVSSLCLPDRVNRMDMETQAVPQAEPSPLWGGWPAGGRGLFQSTRKKDPLPNPSPQGGGASPAISLGGRIHLIPTLGPFDRFLPQFEVNLANQFALLLGCDDFPPLPIKDCARKS